MIRTITRTPTALFAFVLLIALSAPAVQAQQANLVVDDDGEAATGTVDCDATGTTDVFETLEAAVDEANTDTDQDDIYICPGTYGPDENVTINEAITITGAGPDQVTVNSDADNGSATAILLKETQTGGEIQTAELRGFTLAHNGGSNDFVTTINITGGVEGTVIDNVTVTRGSLDDSAAAIRFNDGDVTVENCDISGGPIVAGGSQNGVYTVKNTTLSDAGDEELWLTDAKKLVLRGNTFEMTGDAERDQLALAIYRVREKLVIENNTVEATLFPMLLGQGIPVEINGQVYTPLETVSQMRDLLGANTINGGATGRITFISDGSGALKAEASSPADGASVYALRSTFKKTSDLGGTPTYDTSTRSAVETGDVIHLGDASGAQTSPIFPVDLTVSDELGLATSGENSIRSLTMNDGATVPVTGAVAVTDGATLASNTSIPGDPLILAPGATVTDNGLLEGSLRATRTVEADDETEAFGGIGLSLTATGTAPGEVTVTRTDGDPITEGDGSINRVYDVEAATSTGLTVDVGLEYDDGSNGGDNELSTASVSDVGNLGIFRSTDNGTTWSEIASTSQNLSANRFTGQQLSELGRFTLAKTGGVLPVELAGVTARADGRDAVLSWTTASETNNAGFRIQQQTDTGFETVAFVEGRGTVSGETTYEHRVSNLAFGTHAFRLQQVDADGSTSLSGEARVDIRMDGAYEVSQVAPMPVSGRGRIDVAVNETQTVTVEVFDMLGRQMMMLHDGELRGEQTRTVRVPADTFSSGHYFVRVQGERFQVTRRMVIVQ